MKISTRIAAVLLAAFVVLMVGCESEEKVEPGASPAGDEQAGDEQAGDEQAGDGPAEQQIAAIPVDQTMAGLSQGDSFYVVATPKPNPIPFQELFSLEVKVYESAKRQNLVEGVTLDQVRAIMPAHGHGMKTGPKIVAQDDGTFVVEGMKFHMKGQGDDGLWVVEMVLRKDSKVEQAEFEVQCCRK